MSPPLHVHEVNVKKIKKISNLECKTDCCGHPVHSLNPDQRSRCWGPWLGADQDPCSSNEQKEIVNQTHRQRSHFQSSPTASSSAVGWLVVVVDVAVADGCVLLCHLDCFERGWEHRRSRYLMQSCSSDDVTPQAGNNFEILSYNNAMKKLSPCERSQ